MAKTKKNRPRQTELAFLPSAVPNPLEIPNAGQFIPVYHPQSGDGLKDLARRLAPILAKTGWWVRLSEGEEGGFFLDLQNKEGRSRRLSPEEAQAWQALLPHLSAFEDLFSSSGPGDGKDF